jgi:hypothetical protein
MALWDVVRALNRFFEWGEWISSACGTIPLKQRHTGRASLRHRLDFP